MDSVTGSSFLVENAKGEITQALVYGNACFSTTNDEEKEILNLIEKFQEEIMLCVDPSNILKFIEDEDQEQVINKFYDSDSYRSIVNFAVKIKANIIEKRHESEGHSNSDFDDAEETTLSVNKNDQQLSQQIASVGTLIKSVTYDKLTKKLISFELKYICRNSGNTGTVGFDTSQIEYIREIARNNDLSYIGKYNEIDLSVDELRSKLKPILRWKKLSTETIKASSHIVDEFKQKWNNQLEVEITENNTKYELMVKDKFNFVCFTTTF